MIEMILAYVPESEHLDYNEALALDEERDAQEANELLHQFCEPVDHMELDPFPPIGSIFPHPGLTC